MALIANPLAVAATTAQKQIAVQGTDTANVVLYTVPTGRKFIGSFAPHSLATSQVFINGTYIRLNVSQTSGSVTSAIPVTLIEGTVIMSVGNPYACGLFGVESDA